MADDDPTEVLRPPGALAICPANRLLVGVLTGHVLTLQETTKGLRSVIREINANPKEVAEDQGRAIASGFRRSASTLLEAAAEVELCMRRAPP